MKKTLLLLATALLTAVSSFAETATLVTSTSDLVAGGKYVIACPSENVAMTAENPGKFFKPVDVTINDNAFTFNASDNVAVIELVQSGEKWNLKLGEQYLVSKDEKTIKLGTPGTDVTITVDATSTTLDFGKAVGKLVYNAAKSGLRFTTYTSKQTAVALYKVDSGEAFHPLGNITWSYGDVADAEVADGTDATVEVGTKVTFKAANATKMTIGENTVEEASIDYTVTENSDVTVKAEGVDKDGNETSKQITVKFTAAAPTLGEIMVTLPDGSTTVEDGEHEIMLGQSIVAAAENAESIKIEAIHDDNTSYAVEANSWTPVKVGNHLVTVTATLGNDVKEHNFWLNVTPLPETTTDDLTVKYFDFGNGYTCKTKVSEDIGVKYCAKATSNSGIQINTTGSKNAANSGIVTTVNPYGYIIDRIEVETSGASKLIVSVSNSANSTIDFEGTDMTKTGVALAESALSGDNYITKSGENTTYTFTPKGNYTYMGITSTGAVQLTGVKVYYKAAPADLLVSGTDGELTGDMLSIDKFGNGGEWYPVTVIAPVGYTVYYNINSPRAKVDGVSLNAKANTEAAAMATAAEADDFTNSGKQAITIGLSSEGQFSVYAKNSNGNQTETKTFTVNGRATGVEDIAVDGVEDGEAVYYNMQGVRVANPAAGSLYIRVQGSKAAKVLVK